MHILGPVFWYDLTRVARRQHLARMRVFYAAGLLIALALLYANAFPRAGWFDGHTVATAQFSQMAAFATSVFAVFSAVQLAAVVLITPALTATALAEERSQNTLSFLLTSQLSSREIVLGKLLTRLLLVAMLVLTGLPIFGVLQLFGGVDQLLIIAVFIATGVTALSLGALGLAHAVFVKKPQQAALRTYQLLATFAVCSSVWIWAFDLPVSKRIIAARPPTFIRMANGGWRVIPAPPVALPPLSTPQKLLEAANVGNPFLVAQQLYYELSNDGDVKEVVPRVVGRYVAFHGLVAALCVTLAVTRLRAVSARHATGLVAKKSILLKPAPHPPIKDRPVLWKEMYCEVKPRQRWFAMFFSKWFFFVSFLPAWVLVVLGLSEFDLMTSLFFNVLKYGGTLVAVGVLLRVALHAARGIGSERDRGTLDGLLTTYLSPNEIFHDKWWGSLLSGRWVFIWLVIHWSLGVLAMTLHYFAFALLFLEVLAFGAFIASLGLYFSAGNRTTKHAVATTLFIGLVGTTALPWLVGQFLSAVSVSELDFYSARIYGPAPRSWPELTALALSPPRVLYETVVSQHQLVRYAHIYQWDSTRWQNETAPTAVFSIVVYWFMAVLIKRFGRIRFQRRFGRDAQVRNLRNGSITVTSPPSPVATPSSPPSHSVRS